MTLALVPKVPPLLDYIKQLSPDFQRPEHLAEYCTILERACYEPLRVMCTYPIRHFKTETTLHGVVRMLEVHPTWRIVLMAHDWERVKWMGKRTRALAERTLRDGYPGVRVGPTKGWNEIHYWQNDQGGGVLIMSPEQSREGFDCNALICDDPINEIGYESTDTREQVDLAINNYTGRCQRLGEPGPVILTMSRFGVDDPIGRRRGRKAVTWVEKGSPAIINLGGVDPKGNPAEERAFAPSVWSLKYLKDTRAERAESDARERWFWARLQGQPLPPADSAFGPATFYDWLPDYPGYRDAMGLDMSFSKSKRADWAAIVITRWWGPKCFVRLVHRFRADLGLAAQELVRLRREYNLTCPIFTYVSGPEKGAVTHLQMMGLPVIPIHAGSPKFVRAQRTIDAHNLGKIVWPNDAMAKKVLGRLENWTGNENEPDDEADALVSVYDGCASGAGGGTRSLGAWRY